MADRAMFGSSRALSAVLAALVALLTFGITANSASASQPITSFDVGTSTTQVGGHPDIETTLELADPGDPETAKNLVINLPRGVFGNPNAVTQCTTIDFALKQCPIGSQVGLVTIGALQTGNPSTTLGTAPVFNVEPREDETARFGFNVPTVNIPISVPIAVRTGTDYGLRMTVAGITQEIPLSFFHFEAWGFPAATSHDTERFGIGSLASPAGCPGLSDAGCLQFPRGAAITLHPLTVNPTVCTGAPLVTTVDVETYQDPAHPSHAEADSGSIGNCTEEVFNPVLNVALTTTETDSAAGMDMQLKSPQFLGLAAAPSQIRSATVTLPEGLSINPDAADGQTACTEAQANFGSEGPDSCPDSATIGTFDMLTPALSGPLEGSLYFGEAQPGNQYRVFMIARGFGINAKLVAEIHPDPQTGRLTISVVDLPQVPFEQFNIHLFASQRGLLATPTSCTLYTTDSIFIPWNAALATQHSRPTFSIDSGPGGSPCPGPARPFEPRLVAGTSSPVAGSFSSFTLRLDRDDGDQFLGDLNFTMPPGFTGMLRGLTYCPEAAIGSAANVPGRSEQAAPSCPQSSQIGTTNVAAGPGTHPFHVAGRIYIAGPLDGAPLSLVAITPALAGPYDYGTQVVRVALHVDRRDAHVEAVSQKMPQIIGGIPIRMRSIQVNLDRPRFVINPTNCDPFTIASQGIGDQGTIADFGSFFHAVDCAKLGFKPRMTMKLLGGSRAAKRTKNPAIQFDLRTRDGDANVRSVAVTLSKAFAIDQRHLGNICSKAQLESELCAGRQPIGDAWVKTPLLDQPLSGPAYAVSGFGNLPHVAFILDGQVRVVPQAESASVGEGRLRTLVPTVPDTPIGHFRLTLLGGAKGYLINTRNLCSSSPVTTVRYVGQNGKIRTQHTELKMRCSGNSSR
jgi:hypothetical protein